jgi:hypothetical protein
MTFASVMDENKVEKWNFHITVALQLPDALMCPAT